MCIYSSLPKSHRTLRMLSLVCLLGWLGLSMAQAQTNVLTQHNDNARTGANRTENLLTPSTVLTQFGKLFSHFVDGNVYAQPLYVAKTPIKGKGVHNVVFVATEHNGVYAFDTDNADGDNANPLWYATLTPGNATTVPNGDTGSGDIQPEIGITGTPVIDLETQTLYVVSKIKQDVGPTFRYVQRLHALDLQDGSEKFGGPMVIEGQVKGTGDGSENGVLNFHPLRHMNRPALLLSKGVVYVLFSAHGDVIPYHGWVFAYDAATLQRLGVHCTSPNGKTDPSGYPLGGGGIWMAGGGPAADAQGNLYFLTGNGTFSAPSKGTGIDYGDSFVKLSPSLSVLDYFTPFNEDNLNRTDADLGSGGLTLLPESVGSVAHPRLLVGAGKEGKVYLIDRDNMGKFTSGSDAVVQSLPGAVGGTWSKPAYFHGKVYFLGNGDVIKAFGISNGALTLTPVSQGNDNFPYPGATPSISANGDQDGIAWVIKRGTDSAVLQAYNAEDLSKKLYDSSQTEGRDVLGPYTKFTVPTVADGRVFVGTANSIEVFGRGKWVAKPLISPPGGNFFPFVEVQITCATPDALIRYTTDGSDPGDFSPLYTGPFRIDSCSQVRARAFVAGYTPSATATAYFVIDEGAGNGDGLLAQYFNDPGDGSHLGKVVVERVDPVINFINSGQPPAPGIGGVNWSARWTGFLLPRCSSQYNFATYTDDGIRLWVNNQLVIDNWTYHGPTWNYGTINLEAGKRVPIKVEFFQGQGQSYMRLLWAQEGGAYEVVPQAQLFSGKQTKLRMPTILPRCGTFETSQQVTILKPHPDAEIRYTLDGSEPGPSSALSTGVLVLTESAVIRAKAFLVGSIPSDSASNLYLHNPNPAVYRINAGGLNAAPFTADQFFTGGEGHSRVGAVDTSLVVAPAPQAVYEAERFSNAFGDFSYLVEGLNSNTDYLLRLHFEDSDYSQVGERVFNLLINNQPYLIHYDIIADAGAPFKAVVKEYVARSGNNGKIRLSFESVTAYAKISGIEVIPALAATGVVGTGDGVNATYYDNPDFTGTTVSRIEKQINFDWGSGTPAPEVGTEYFSCLWTGYVQPPYTGEYTFHTLADNGARLWIDDKMLVDDWNDNTTATWRSGTICLEAGRKYKLRMEHYENRGLAVAQLHWSGPRTPLQPVPQSQLYTKAFTSVSGKLTFLECLQPKAQTLVFTFHSDGGETFDRKVEVAADGTFKVVELPLARYNISVYVPRWLRRTTTADASSGPAVGLQIDLIPGDANHDNWVDIFDLATLAEAFNSEPGDLNYNVECDFNCDTHVNLFDLAVLAQYFYTQGDE